MNYEFDDSPLPDDTIPYVNRLIIDTVLQSEVFLRPESMPLFDELSDYSFESVSRRLKILCGFNPWTKDGNGTFAIRMKADSGEMQPHQIQIIFDGTEIQMKL